MTIEQMVEIPADRRLIVDVPREIPAGPVILAFTPVKAKTSPDTLPSGSYSAVEDAIRAAAEKAADLNRKPISRHFGTLPTHTFGDPVAYQRAVRDDMELKSSLIPAPSLNCLKNNMI